MSRGQAKVAELVSIMVLQWGDVGSIPSACASILKNGFQGDNDMDMSAMGLRANRRQKRQIFLIANLKEIVLLDTRWCGIMRRLH